MACFGLDCHLCGAVALLALSALSACTSMPVTSMVKLARTDFTTVDPAALRIAVKLPQGLRPRPKGVRLRLRQQAFVLGDLADTGELLSLAGELTKGHAIYAFGLDPADLPRLEAMRAEMLARKARGGRGSLTLNVAADACRIGPLPADTLLTTYLRTDPGGDFFPLVRDA